MQEKEVQTPKLTTFADLMARRRTTTVTTSVKSVFDIRSIVMNGTFIPAALGVMKVLKDEAIDLDSIDAVAEKLQEMINEERYEDAENAGLVRLAREIVSCGVTSINLANKPFEECDIENGEYPVLELSIQEILELMIAVLMLSNPESEVKNSYKFEQVGVISEENTS